MQRSSCSRLRASTSPKVLIVLTGLPPLSLSNTTEGLLKQIRDSAREAGSRRLDRGRLCRPAEPCRRGTRGQRADGQAAGRVVLVVGARRHVVGRVAVEQRGEQFDLPAADTQL